jgi:NADH-quinone oxidoreductase subunit D
MALGMTGPVLRSPACRWDLRKSQPYCGYETYDFDVPTATRRRLRPLRIRIEEMWESMRSSSRPGAAASPGPVMVEDKKIAWPAQLSVGSDGMGNSPDHIRHIMGESMEALIHHFKLVTEGFRVPPGQVYAAVESPGRAGLPRGLRRRHPALPGPLP